MNMPQNRPSAQPTQTLAKRIRVLSGLICILAAMLASARAAASDPFATIDKAFEIRKGMTESKLREYIQTQVEAAAHESANELLLIAELMKQMGDYRAADYYERAISYAEEEAAHELFYADYLRNVRGPQRPLFEEAEEHYFTALAKLHRQASPPPWSPEVRERVLRGLVALYQKDGIPLAWHKDSEPGAPFLFFSSIAHTARSTSDLDEVHDMRDWTAEALFSQSAQRLNRPLTDEELSGLIRRKEPALLYERLRYRVEGATIDVSYEGRNVRDAQVSDFLRPNEFNRVRVDDVGAEFAIAFDQAPSFDGYFRQALHLANRRGLIESSPTATERIFQSETELAFSRFSGPDKIDLTFIFVGQGIKPQIADPPRRYRSIFATRLNYQVLRPLGWLHYTFRDRFATRGLHLFVGLADDRENFDEVQVRKADYFIGTSIRGLGPFDITLQPTIFTQRVTGDKSQASSQLRLDGILVLRLLDEERNPGIPRSFLGLRPAFVHLVIPAKRDRALDGLSAFENDRVGIGLDTKLFVMRPDDLARASTARFGATSLLLSYRYSRERFPRLDKRVNLMELSFGLGF